MSGSTEILRVLLDEENTRIILPFYLVVAIATTRYCSGFERIPVIIFVSLRVDSLMFERSLVFPRQELR